MFFNVLNVFRFFSFFSIVFLSLCVLCFVQRRSKSVWLFLDYKFFGFVPLFCCVRPTVVHVCCRVGE